MGEKRIRKVTFIPAIRQMAEGVIHKRRVAAYARVSTTSEEQETSLAAQRDYYENHIKANNGWEFVDVYYDDGISGLSFKNREGFNKMIDDALAGKIDLILTKSLSRFARNTVDTLTIIRKLKEKNVEVFFEKEDIHTLDSKGEFLITLMSSLAQEESRSISENITWGRRKQFADGKYSLAYSSFMGYERGPNDTWVIDEADAIIVRLIYLLFLEGWTVYKIAEYLTQKGYPSPKCSGRWHASTVESMLSNEKYKGDALLQKEFTVDYLTKKMKKNEGEVPQYYLEDVHPAIVSKKVSGLAFAELARRKSRPYNYSSLYPWASSIVCECCGSYYGLKQLHRSGVFYGYYWRCNEYYNNHCKSMTIYDETLDCYGKLIMKELFDKYPDVLEICAKLLNELVEENCEPVSAEILYGMLFDKLETFNLDYSSIRTIITKVYPKTKESMTFMISDGSEVVFDARSVGKALLHELQDVIASMRIGVVEELDDLSESTVTIPKKNNAMSAEQQAQIIEMYLGGASLDQISDELHIKKATVTRFYYRKCLDKGGVENIAIPNIRFSNDLDMKSKVLILRVGGYSYRKITQLTGLAEATIKGWCYRAGLGGVRSGPRASNGRCKWCGAEIEQGRTRKKDFCSDSCRLTWWGNVRKAQRVEEMLLSEKNYNT